jgi:hypothetical protein
VPWRRGIQPVLTRRLNNIDLAHEKLPVYSTYKSPLPVSLGAC